MGARTATEALLTTIKQWVGNVAGSGKSKELFGRLRRWATALMTRDLKSDMSRKRMRGCEMLGGSQVWVRRDAMQRRCVERMKEK